MQGLLLLLGLPLISAYNILVIFPTPSFSHQRYQISVSKALAAHGHHVTILSPDPFDTSNPNITQISLRELYDGVGKVLQEQAVNDNSIRQTTAVWADNSVRSMRDILANPGVRELLSDETRTFDAVLVEYLGYAAMHAFAEKYDAPLIGLTSLQLMPWADQLLGNPTHALLNPGFSYYYPDNPGILTKIKMVFDFYDIQSYFWRMVAMQNPLIREYFPESRLTAEQHYANVDFAIENTSPMLGKVRPLLPNTKQVSFMHIEPPQALPQDLQEYLDSSERGVVYLSFGSNVKSVNIGHRLMDILVSAVGSLPYDVLWKFENGSMPNRPPNVRTIQWSPQMDLLAHPKIRLFVTQGGLQSFEEALSRGVPMVVIPFFGDQQYNAGQIEKIGVARKIFKHDLTSDGLRGAILEVIRDPRYKRRAIELSRQVQDTPMNATETAVWHIEHVIRNRGAEMFRYRGKSMAFCEFCFLDVIAVVLLALGLVVVGLKVVLARCWKSTRKTLKTE